MSTSEEAAAPAAEEQKPVGLDGIYMRLDARLEIELNDMEDEKGQSPSDRRAAGVAAAAITRTLLMLRADYRNQLDRKKREEQEAALVAQVEAAQEACKHTYRIGPRGSQCIHCGALSPRAKIATP